MNEIIALIGFLLTIDVLWILFCKRKLHENKFGARITSEDLENFERKKSLEKKLA